MPDRVIDLSDARRGRHRTDDDLQAQPVDTSVMHRVGLMLNSTLALPEVLDRLARLTLDLTDAHRCSLFLLRGRLLEPAVAIGTVRDEDLWAAFREMGPVRLDDLPRAWSRLTASQAIPIEDATTSQLVPGDWVDRFDLRSLVLVPLHAAGDPCGLLVVDHPTRRRYQPQELALLESIAAYSGVAVRNARLFESTQRQARMQRTLAQGASALVAPERAGDLLDELVAAFSELLEAETCGIGLFDDDLTRITTVATNTDGPRVPPIPISNVPRELVGSLTEIWRDEPGRPVTWGEDPWFARVLGQRTGCPHHLVVPLSTEDGLRGAVLAGFDSPRRVDAQERRSVLALAALTAAGLERTAMVDRLERHGRHMEALYEASTAVVDGADSEAIGQRLNRLLAPAGIEVDSLAWRDPDLASRLGGAVVDDEELEAWGEGATPDDQIVGDMLSVPMRLEGRAVGALRLRTRELDPDDRVFIDALARGVAEVAQRGALRASLESAARNRAVSDERDRIAADLHDVVGQLFIAIGLLARRAEQKLPKESEWSQTFRRIADLGDSGKWKIDQAVRALAFVPAAHRGLPAALRDRVDSLREDSGISVLLEVRDWPTDVAPAIERTLYRVAHEAMTNAWRHARCTVVRVCLDVGDDEVVLSVKDDGIGLRSSGGLDHVGIGLRSMRRATKDVGGSLRLHNIRPHGTEVEARIPLGVCR